MKKLLIGLILIGSASLFAQENCKVKIQDLNYDIAIFDSTKVAIEELGYDTSPNFIEDEASYLLTASSFSHSYWSRGGVNLRLYKVIHKDDGNHLHALIIQATGKAAYGYGGVAASRANKRMQKKIEEVLSACSTTY